MNLENLADRVAAVRQSIFRAANSFDWDDGFDNSGRQDDVATKIVLLAGDDPIIYLTTNLTDQGEGVIVAFTPQLLIRTTLTFRDVNGRGVLEYGVSATALRLVTSLEILRVSPTAVDQWPQRLSILTVIDGNELTLPSQYQAQGEDARDLANLVDVLRGHLANG